MLATGYAAACCRDFWSFNVARLGISIALGAYQCTVLSIRERPNFEMISEKCSSIFNETIRLPRCY